MSCTAARLLAYRSGLTFSLVPQHLSLNGSPSGASALPVRDARSIPRSRIAAAGTGVQRPRIVSNARHLVADARTPSPLISDAVPWHRRRAICTARYTGKTTRRHGTWPIRWGREAPSPCRFPVLGGRCGALVHVAVGRRVGGLTPESPCRRRLSAVDKLRHWTLHLRSIPQWGWQRSSTHLAAMRRRSAHQGTRGDNRDRTQGHGDSVDPCQTQRACDQCREHAHSSRTRSG